MAKKKIAPKPHKRTHTYGKPVYRPTISTILVCSCGGKYIKTREGQTTCILCISRLQSVLFR